MWAFGGGSLLHFFVDFVLSFVWFLFGLVLVVFLFLFFYTGQSFIW